REARKEYWAVVAGGPPAGEATWEDWLCADDTGLGVVQVCRPGTPRARRGVTPGPPARGAPPPGGPAGAPPPPAARPRRPPRRPAPGPGRRGGPGDPGGCGLRVRPPVPGGDRAARAVADDPAPGPGPAGHVRGAGARGVGGGGDRAG